MQSSRFSPLLWIALIALATGPILKTMASKDDGMIPSNNNNDEDNNNNDKNNKGNSNNNLPNVPKSQFGIPPPMKMDVSPPKVRASMKKFLPSNGNNDIHNIQQRKFGISPPRVSNMKQNVDNNNNEPFNPRPGQLIFGKANQGSTLLSTRSEISTFSNQPVENDGPNKLKSNTDMSYLNKPSFPRTSLPLSQNVKPNSRRSKMAKAAQELLLTLKGAYKCIEQQTIGKNPCTVDLAIFTGKDSIFVKMRNAKIPDLEDTTTTSHPNTLHGWERMFNAFALHSITTGIPSIEELEEKYKVNLRVLIHVLMHFLRYIANENNPLQMDQVQQEQWKKWYNDEVLVMFSDEDLKLLPKDGQSENERNALIKFKRNLDGHEPEQLFANSDASSMVLEFISLDPLLTGNIDTKKNKK